MPPTPALRPAARRAAPALLALALAACRTAPTVAHLGADPQRPFSDAVRVGALLYVSGKLGTDPATGRLVAGGIAAETRQALANVRASLERHGSGIDRVVKCTCFLADIAEWQAMTDAYVGAFPADRRPARTALAVGALPLAGRVEIECVAAVR